MPKPKIIAIVGPTATGKSDLAVEIAREFNGEVISADSRQVYRGLNIGSGKITTEEMKGVPHHMLDVADPSARFTVADFQKQAHEAIDDILKRNKLPIIVGGTGFYIQSIIDGVSLPEVPPNEPLREELETHTTEELASTLQEKDPARFEDIDIHNRTRLIRALEITDALGTVPKQPGAPRYDSLQIGLELPNEELKEKISLRLAKRMDEGMIEEVTSLHENALSFDRLEELGLEYRYVAYYLQEKMTKEEMVTELTTKIYQYAKRQKTWFKKDERIQWFHPSEYLKMKEAVEEFLDIKKEGQ